MGTADAAMEEQQQEEEDMDSKVTDLHVLRQELEKSMASDTHLSLRISENMYLDGPTLGSVVSEIDREPAVVVHSFQHGNVPIPTEHQVKDSEQSSVSPVEDKSQLQQGNYHGDGNALKGVTVTKKFGRKFYNGEIIGFDPETNWYKIVYEDGDQEDLWWWELEPLLLEHQRRMESLSKKRSRPAKVQTKVLKDDQGQQELREELIEQELQEELIFLCASATSSEDSDSDTKRSGRSRKSRKTRKAMSAKTILTSEETPRDSAKRRKKKPKTSLQNERADSGQNLVGRRIKRTFEGRDYVGKVIDYDSTAKYYKIVYEDGDEEELDLGELRPTLLDNADKLVTSREVLDEAESSHCSVEDTNLGTNKLSTREKDRALSRTVSPVSRGSLHDAFEASRFPANDAQDLEFLSWGEAAIFNKAKCPELRAVKMLPTNSLIVDLAASHHHLAVLTGTSQVYVWRHKHGNIRERCDQWEHVSGLDDKEIVLIDIAGPDLDRSSAGYSPNQEDQIPDPFFLVAVSRSGNDYILQGSQPQEAVHTYSLMAEHHNPSLLELLKLTNMPMDNVGRICQLSVGTVDTHDEPPFIGYITDTDRVYMRSATKDFMEEVNYVTGFTGKPLKIQCGSAYHAIIMTDDGHAWTWGRGYCSGTSSSVLSACQPALGTLVNRKVVDVASYGENFVALTDDGEVHQWTHGLPNTALGVHNFPSISLSPKLSTEDKLEKVALGGGVCAGITRTGKLHTWKTSLGHEISKTCATPLGRNEKRKETRVTALGTSSVLKVISVAGSLIAIGQKNKRNSKEIKI